MKKEELIQKAYEIAVERYAAVGVDTEQVLKTMQDFHLSLHCWQADDVAGFEVQAGSLTGVFRQPVIIRAKLVILMNCVLIF